MTAQLLDGKKLAQTLKDQMREELKQLKSKNNSVPFLVNILVGTDPGSSTYAKSQKNAAEYVGIQYELKILPEKTSQNELIDIIKKLNQDPNVNGIMLHKPLPAHMDSRVVTNFIDIAKDLEGINVTNIGKMALGETSIIPCTPASVMEHIKSIGVSLRGKEVVIVGRSEIVGKPLIFLFLQQHATVTVCHSATNEVGKLSEHVKRAEVLVVALGKPLFVKGDWIKSGAIVIDVGINQVGSQIVGDVEFDKAKEKASFITPVPGGVGPLTVVMLMRNGIEAFRLQKKELTRV
jgi:methylenetetrahydrofolate dehydrogenase (NADP+)/methenyltetrahydrofolate cyclohydrolase